ncbi:unnamed protein product [Closterium sp. NIES-54]
MLALCREHRLEHRTKHIALRYFLARELQQRGQLRLAYVASEANTADIFTKALAPGDHQRFCTMLETSHSLCWTGEVGDALAFRVWGALSLVRDTTVSKLSPCTLRCIFMGFPTYAPPWQGPAPSGVSQVDTPPLVEPLVVSSNTSGPAEGGDPAVDDTAATSRSPRLETPPGFPPRPSLPPLQPVAVDSGAAGIGDTRD